MTVDNGFFDRGPMNVSGAITARRARVMWKEGTLYVFTTPKTAQVVTTTEPTLDGDMWSVVQTSDGEPIYFTRRGCPTCGWGLGRYSAPDLLSKI